MTPHPREFSRLAGIPAARILADPVTAASGFSKRYGVTVLLKGATSVAATGDRVSLLPAAGVALILFSRRRAEAQHGKRRDT